jgi:hypothetical protein
VEGVIVGEEDEQRILRWENMVDGIHILKWNRAKKPLAIV